MKIDLVLALSNPSFSRGAIRGPDRPDERLRALAELDDLAGVIRHRSWSLANSLLNVTLGLQAPPRRRSRVCVKIRFRSSAASSISTPSPGPRAGEGGHRAGRTRRTRSCPRTGAGWPARAPGSPTAPRGEGPEPDEPPPRSLRGRPARSRGTRAVPRRSPSRRDAADLGELHRRQLAGAQLGGTACVVGAVHALVGRDRDRGLVVDDSEVLEVRRWLLCELDSVSFHRGEPEHRVLRASRRRWRPLAAAPVVHGPRARPRPGRRRPARPP